MTIEDNSGVLVQHRDGRKGIAYREDQEKDFNGKGKGKLLITMTDEDWKPRDVAKHIISEEKLEIKGYID